MNHERPHVTVTNNLLRCALYEKIHVLMRQKCLLKRSLTPNKYNKINYNISLIKYSIGLKPSRGDLDLFLFVCC